MSLYDAGVMFMVSDRTESDAWEAVCKEVTRLQVTNTNISDIKAIFKTTEDQLKKDYSITTLPSKWRSAKSVVLTAIENCVGLNYPSSTGADNREFKGKTFVEKEIKEIKSKSISVAAAIGSEDWHVCNYRDIIDALNKAIKFADDLAGAKLAQSRLRVEEADRMIGLLNHLKNRINAIHPGNGTTKATY
jgi:hypothetical protein